MLKIPAVLLSLGGLVIPALSSTPSLDRRWATDFTFTLPYDTAALEPFISNQTNVVHLKVDKDFGGFANLLAALNAETLLVPASGWGWLAWDTVVQSLIVTFTNNKDLLDSTLLPLLNIDIFEHAFFLDVKSNKTLYLENLEHIYNWEGVSKVFAAATKNNAYYATSDDASKLSKINAVEDVNDSDSDADHDKKTSHTALAVGLAVAGVAIVAALGAGAFFLKKRLGVRKSDRLPTTDAHQDSEKLLAGAARAAAKGDEQGGLPPHGRYVDTSISQTSFVNPYDSLAPANYVLPPRESR
ncbi:hypothetical protein RQP46_006900 [Phenoliferia psychrophenolica]